MCVQLYLRNLLYILKIKPEGADLTSFNVRHQVVETCCLTTRNGSFSVAFVSFLLMAAPFLSCGSLQGRSQRFLQGLCSLTSYISDGQGICIPFGDRAISGRIRPCSPPQRHMPCSHPGWSGCDARSWLEGLCKLCWAGAPIPAG